MSYNIERVVCFLDMDGVLTNFVGGINTFMGIPYDTIPTKWDWWTDHSHSFEQINTICGVDFWANLDWMPDGKQILEMVEATFDDIYLLTTPMPNPGSATGKELWIEKHIPQYKNQMIITRASKVLFAGPDRILIDDNDQNIHSFVAAGGQGILIPRPWNELHNWSDMVLEVLGNSLEDFR